MATQGLVTVRKDGKVILKIVAGSDGYNAPLLEAAIRQLGRPPDDMEARDLAVRHHFGTPSDLAIVSDGGTVVLAEDSEINTLYESTFNDPNFNPRWKQGVVAHTIVIDF